MVHIKSCDKAKKKLFAKFIIFSFITLSNEQHFVIFLIEDHIDTFNHGIT